MIPVIIREATSQDGLDHHIEEKKKEKEFACFNMKNAKYQWQWDNQLSPNFSSFVYGVLIQLGGNVPLL